MQFLISTTTTDVLVSDLGVFIPHPTVDRDLATEFSLDDLSESDDLTWYITNEVLVLKIDSAEYGIYTVDPALYNPNILLQQNIALESNESLITESELSAGFATTTVYSGTFPIAVTSTSSGTNIVTSNDSKFQDWGLAPGDVVYLSGTGPSDGYNSIQSIIDQNNLITANNLFNSSGMGMLWVFHPPGASRVGVDNRFFTTVTGATVQEVIESIDLQITGGGISAETHKSLRQLIHLANGGPFEGFATGAYKETLPSGSPFPTTIVWWESSAKLKKIVEKQISYSLGKAKPTPITYIVYSTDGVTPIVTVTDNVVYNGPFEISRTRSVA